MEVGEILDVASKGLEIVGGCALFAATGGKKVLIFKTVKGLVDLFACNWGAAKNAKA